MSAFLRKYGTGTGADVYLPMIKRGVVDQAVSADWTPAAGDVKISIDGAAAANIGTLPTAVAMGNGAEWKFVFADAELQGKRIVVVVADSATKAVEDQFFVIETYGNASAMYQADLSAANLPANMLQLGSSTQSATDMKDFADTGYDPATHKVAGVVLSDTVTTLTDLPAAPTDWVTAAAVEADAVTKIQSGLATPTNITAASGVVLASDGLDSVSTTAPAGVASNYREMMIQLWRRFFKKATMTATQIKTYADDGTTVLTTETVSDDGTTQTKGAAS